ncbi:hypothetical protein ACLB2K_076010 [Fragaria x ananassa]
MVNLRRTRKRVRAIPRAPDGSAFQNCNKCGVSVAVALAGMHECEPSKKVKRFKEFTKTRKGRDWIEINREGFEVWKKMSEKERQPYVKEAERIDEAYQKALLKESNDGLKVDDEADSAKSAGNNGKFGEVGIALRFMIYFFFTGWFDNFLSTKTQITRVLIFLVNLGIILFEPDLGIPTIDRPMVHQFTLRNRQKVSDC